MFRPYHSFSNCRKLENTITILNNNGSVAPQALGGYKRYHFALIHKLRSVKYHLDSIENIVVNTAPQDAVSRMGDFLFKINLAIDGYFHSAGSVLDILAREVLTYFGENLPDNVYFKTARETLSRSRPGDSILQRLDDPLWKRDFSMYRNALTHEVIIAHILNLELSLNGQAEIPSLIVPLPDDPRMNPMDRSFSRYPNVLKYTQDCFKKILRLVNPIYGEIIQRADTQGSLPL